jgi:putative DNA-invertase from lambdoid prophage Rac
MSRFTSGVLVGYARISSSDQAEHGQVDALRSAGASRIIVERVSGVAERPLLDELICSFAQGDTLVVTEVSRLGRSTSDVLLLVDDLQQCGIHLRILNLGIDTGTPAGGLVVTMMAGLARFERDLLRERQRRGMEAARQRGSAASILVGREC